MYLTSTINKTIIIQQFDCDRVMVFNAPFNNMAALW